MGRTIICQICKHPERARIELMRAAGISLSTIAEKCGVERNAVNRHWHSHVSEQMKASYLAGPMQLEQLAQKAADQGSSVLRVVLFHHLSTATEHGDTNQAANVAGRLTHLLETIARISGELGSLARSTINITTNNSITLTSHPQFLKLQSSLLQALAPFPEARAAVVGALRDLDGENGHKVPAVSAKALPEPMVIEQ